MRERPILFSAPMVRAILEGRKTQTRRIIKPMWRIDLSRLVLFRHPEDAAAVCPYGAPGDRLWVRETHAIESNRGIDDETRYPPPFTDGRPIAWREDPEDGRYWMQCHYRATDPDPELVSLDSPDDARPRWRPSIHMPRWASRISLEVRAVRVERLGDITEADAAAEGCGRAVDLDDVDGAPDAPAPRPTYRGGYMDLWDAINGAGSWDVNPWVWVVEFGRVNP